MLPVELKSLWVCYPGVTLLQEGLHILPPEPAVTPGSQAIGMKQPFICP